MTLGAEHEQAAIGLHLLAFGQHFGLDPGFGGLALRPFRHAGQFAGDAGFLIAAQLDVSPTAGHVGGNGDGADAAGVFHDHGFLLVITGVEHHVLDVLLLQIVRQHLALFDRDGANQHRLAAFLGAADGLHDRLELVFGVLVEFVVHILAEHRHVGGNFHHVQLVDVEEFRGFGGRRAGHAAQLGIHAEIILEGDAGQRLVFRHDLHAFLGLHRLVQTFGPAAAIHHAAGEFIDDGHLAIAHDIIRVAAEDDDGAQRLVQVVHHLRILEIIEILAFQQPGGGEHALHLLGAGFGENNGLLLLIDLDILAHQFLHHGVDLGVELRLVVGGAGDDQRGAGFIDQHAIDFIDHGEIERPLHHLLARVFHVVAQIIEAEFIVGAVGDVTRIGGAARLIIQVGHNHADTEAQEAIDLAHPLRIAAGEIIIHRHHVHALAGQGIQIDRQRRHQRLAFAGAHFGDFAAMQHDAADHLHIEMPHAQHALGGFTHGGKGFGQDVVQRLAGFELSLQLGRLRLQLVIGKRTDLVFQTSDAHDDRPQRLQIAIIRRPENRLRDLVQPEHENPDLAKPWRAARNRVARYTGGMVGDVGSVTLFVNEAAASCPRLARRLSRRKPKSTARRTRGYWRV